MPRRSREAIRAELEARLVDAKREAGVKINAARRAPAAMRVQARADARRALARVQDVVREIDSLEDWSEDENRRRVMQLRKGAADASQG